jgi:[citrate (pro-3S)-lyase] ligase
LSWDALEEQLLYPARDNIDHVKSFLTSVGLGYDPHPDVIVALTTSAGKVVATGSLAGKVVKHMAVADDWQGSGLALRVFDRLYRIARENGFARVLAFTTPKGSRTLESIGFERIEGTADAVLLEFGAGWSGGGIHDYLDKLEIFPRYKRAGAIIMNCNPFTRGHLHLITTASRQCDRVYIFVVSEDRSTFPTAVRKRLIEEGTSHLGNVNVLEGGDYIISSATFPMYFLREPGRATYIQSRLDATIFARKIAPAAGITVRFVGEEPLDPTTGMYNDAMREVFSASGIELVVVPRLEDGGVPISASIVRRALKDSDWTLVETLVPPTTTKFLRSEEAAPIIARLKETDAPH